MFWLFFPYPGNPINPALSSDQDGFYSPWVTDVASSITRMPLAAKGVPFSWLFISCAYLVLATDKIATDLGYTSWKDWDNPAYIHNWDEDKHFQMVKDELETVYRKVDELYHLEHDPNTGVSLYF